MCWTDGSIASLIPPPGPLHPYRHILSVVASPPPLTHTHSAFSHNLSVRSPRLYPARLPASKIIRTRKIERNASRVSRKTCLSLKNSDQKTQKSPNLPEEDASFIYRPCLHVRRVYLCVCVFARSRAASHTHTDPRKTDSKVRLQQELLPQAAPSCEFARAGGAERYGLLSVSVSSSALQPINLLKDAPENLC